MLVVTPNLCFDVTVRLPLFSPGAVTRASSTVTTAGGKGVNVMRASAALGAQHSRLVGFTPNDDAARLGALLSDDAIELIGIQTPGQVRIATI
ncbi:MAG: PfkB family carbohydrate kinase, partial [Nakamurella sp.]